MGGRWDFNKALGGDNIMSSSKILTLNEQTYLTNTLMWGNDIAKWVPERWLGQD